MLYADELKSFETSGITELQVAFSREPGQPRTFVQQLIERERDKVWDLIASRRGDLRLRQRQHHGAWRPRGPDGHLPGQDQWVGSVCRRMAPRTCATPTATWKTSGGRWRLDCELHPPTSPSHDHRGMRSPSGTSSADR